MEFLGPYGIILGVALIIGVVGIFVSVIEERRRKRLKHTKNAPYHQPDKGKMIWHLLLSGLWAEDVLQR